MPPTQFGEKYVLVEHIATGGMAEIYRANYSGIEGFAKELVIKRLRDEFAARSNVVTMFLDEARVAATLTHNNVVHTYDLGEIAGEYYIAMEFLKGQELVAVLRRVAQTGRTIPLWLTLGVIMQSLEGLHYVHSRSDDQGQPLGLVHRDINPTNVFVCYDGVCKIMDFGIAATRASAVTSAGQFAGKLGYMAPEQLLGQRLDGRADIFALGVVLYEMCLGRRLFRGPREELQRRILEGDIPAPTFVDPTFPPALEGIIMKALEVDVADRYQNADHMFRELDKLMQEMQVSWTPRRISAFMVELFGEGAPAEVNYDDDYDDLADEALDFDQFERAQAESAPDWVRMLQRGDDGDVQPRRRALTIGKLEALVSDASETAEDAPATKRAREGSAGHGSGRYRAGTGAHPSGRKTGSRPATGAPHAIVSVGADASSLGNHFGHKVVVEETRKSGMAVGWVLGVVSVGTLAYFAYTVFTAK